MDDLHVKDALGERARLVKDHRFGLGQRLQVVAALDQDALPRRPANAAEKAKRHGDHQRARAGDHQERQRPVKPGRKRLAGDQRREGGQQRGQRHHQRGIYPGKARDEPFGRGLAAGGVLDQVQNLADGRFAVRLGDRRRYQTRQVDAAAEQLLPRLHAPGDGFPGQRRRIERGLPFRHQAVQRDALAGPHDHRLTDLHLAGIDGHLRAVSHHRGRVGPNVHQFADGLPGFAHRVALKQLTHLVEEHHQHALRILPDGERADGRDGHQEIFADQRAADQAAGGGIQHIIADQ